MKAADLQMRATGIQSPQTLRKLHQKPGNTVAHTPESGFGELLQKKVEENRQVQFSAHAVKRLQDRSLDINPDTIERLNEGVKLADAKGAVNSLVLVDNTAFVVSVRNNTVITALNKADTGGKVFTNIDSVAIM